MSSGIRLGRIAGIEVVADGSVLLLAALVAWVLYIEVDAGSAADGAVAVAAALVGGILFIAGILAHELSHALVARRRGLEVAEVRLFIFGGYTSLEGDPPAPRDEAVIAAAGPIASILVAATFAVLSLVTGSWPEIARTLLALAVANLAIAGFNLLPGFPLDGGRVLRAMLWRRSGDRAAATRTAVTAGRVIGFGLMGVGFVVLVWGQDFSGLWWVAVGWLVHRTAAEAGKRQRLESRTDGRTAGDVMRRTPDPVPGDMSVETVVDLFQVGRRLRSLPVEVDGRIRGVLGQQEIDAVAAERRRGITAASAMTGIGPSDVVEVEIPLAVLFSGRGGASGRLVVVRGGRVVGIIEGEEVATLLGDA